MLYSGYTLLYKINTINSLRIIDSLYLAFRIDFGRDDVTKFVLYKEIIEKQPILNYRGESLIATFLFFIPRSLWINKPFPHYRYLTAALYNTQILDIPAGMTPSIFEMSIANFGVILGIIFTLIFLIFCIKISDNEKSIVLKAMYLIMIIGILTQSMDAMIAMIFLSVFNKLFQKLKFMGKVLYRKEKMNILLKNLINSKVIKNGIWMFLLQGFNTIVPLITLPYITRILSPTAYGNFALALNWISYFQVIVEYGFDLTGPRQIVMRESDEDLNKIYSNIISARFILLIVCCIFL